jgi:hypothetical protein
MPTPTASEIIERVKARYASARTTLDRMRSLILAVTLSFSIACVAAPLPTLDMPQDGELLKGMHGTLTYVEDEHLYIGPIDGGPFRHVHTEGRATRPGGIDAKGRIVYAREWMAPSDHVGAVAGPRFEVRLLEPGQPETVLCRTAVGNIFGLAISSDGRVAVGVYEGVPTRLGPDRPIAVHIIDLDTLAEQRLELKLGTWPHELGWSRDERELVYISEPRSMQGGSSGKTESEQPKNARITALDVSSGVERFLCHASHAVPVLDSEDFAIRDHDSFQIADENGVTVRPTRALPGAMPSYLGMIAAPSADRVIYFGLPPAGTKQSLYLGTELSWKRMCAVHLADLSKPSVATIVPQMHALWAVFNSVDLGRALPAGSTPVQ